MHDILVVYNKFYNLDSNTSKVFPGLKRILVTFDFHRTTSIFSCPFCLLFMYFFNFLFNIMVALQIVIIIQNIIKIFCFVLKVRFPCYIFFRASLTIEYYKSYYFTFKYLPFLLIVQINVNIKFVYCIFELLNFQRSGPGLKNVSWKW